MAINYEFMKCYMQKVNFNVQSWHFVSIIIYKSIIKRYNVHPWLNAEWVTPILGAHHEPAVIVAIFCAAGWKMCVKHPHFTNCSFFAATSIFNILHSTTSSVILLLHMIVVKHVTKLSISHLYCRIVVPMKACFCHRVTRWQF